MQNGRVIWNGPDAHGCGLAEAVRTTDPKLGDQTGFPPYLPLGAGSSAIGFARDDDCTTFPIDQKGAKRPATNCDAGRGPNTSPGHQPPKQAAQPSTRRTPRVPDPCTGRDLNNISDLRLTTSYDLCDGTQFQRLDGSGVGIQWIIDGGLLDAVDVWGWVRPTVEVCFPQAGKTFVPGRQHFSALGPAIELLPRWRLHLRAYHQRRHDCLDVA